MFSRKHIDSTGTQLPEQWLNRIAAALNEFFQGKLAESEIFECYGEIYADELLLAISKIQSDHQETSNAITLFLSLDISKELFQNMKKIRPLVDKMVDLAGIVFQDVVGQKSWSDFEPAWQEYLHQKHTFHYKITRENIELTLQANDLLNSIKS